MKKEKINDKEVWSALLNNPKEFIHAITYGIVSATCIAAIVLIHIACSR